MGKLRKTKKADGHLGAPAHRKHDSPWPAGAPRPGTEAEIVPTPSSEGTEIDEGTPELASARDDSNGPPVLDARVASVPPRTTNGCEDLWLESGETLDLNGESACLCVLGCESGVLGPDDAITRGVVRAFEAASVGIGDAHESVE